MKAESGFQSIEQLLPAIYPELRRMAAQLLRRERAEHTLQPTALVNEALLRLCKGKPVPWDEPAQFIALVVREMRRELTDHARAFQAKKRSWHLRSEAPDEIIDERLDLDTLVALDRALTKLEQINPRTARLVEMRYYGGLTNEEIGVALGITPRTVERNWETARHWLFLECNEQR